MDKSFLPTHELALLENKEMPADKLILVRDLFVFSCYTGLSYIDLMNLLPSNVCVGIDDEYWIRSSRVKTEVPINVPLLPQARALMEKYRNDPRSKNRGKSFQVSLIKR